MQHQLWRRVSPTLFRRCPAPESPAGGEELLLSREVFNSGGSNRRQALEEGRQQLGRTTNVKVQVLVVCVVRDGLS